MRVLSGLLLITCCFVFAGCGGDRGGLVTEQGEMTMQEYDQLKQEELNRLPKNREDLPGS